jgi:hypothetical protein
MAHFVETGTVADLDRHITTAPHRAVQAARQQRKAQKTVNNPDS